MYIPKNDYIYLDDIADCPICGNKTLQLMRTRYAQPSPWLDGSYHHFFGAVCKCGAKCDGIFIPNGNHDDQLKACIKDIIGKSGK